MAGLLGARVYAARTNGLVYRQSARCVVCVNAGGAEGREYVLSKDEMIGVLVDMAFLRASVVRPETIPAKQTRLSFYDADGLAVREAYLLGNSVLYWRGLYYSPADSVAKTVIDAVASQPRE